MRTETEIRVEERTATELQGQVETVFNKDEMIDAPGTNCLRGDIQIVVKMLTGRSITFDVRDQ